MKYNANFKIYIYSNLSLSQILDTLNTLSFFLLPEEIIAQGWSIENQTSKGRMKGAGGGIHPGTGF